MMITTSKDHDKLNELKAFDDSKSGVKGLVDSGITKIPSFFQNPRKDLVSKATHLSNNNNNIPVIDLGGLNDLESLSSDPNPRKEVVERVKEASESWGFFQVINHGIPLDVVEEIKNRVARFYEQDDEKKKEFYSRDVKRKFVYNSNFDLFNSEMANWRDTFFSYMAPNPPNPEELPEACRNEMILYTKEVMKLGIFLFGLLSEALGLESDHLKDMGCAEGLVFIGHYYPACPEPELTMGTTTHSDNDFLTLLLQDHVGGLQVFRHDQWFDVSPIPGALVVNIGDLLQLISNDKFKSVEHRVLANRNRARVSVACFFSTSFQPSSKLYGPIQELLSEDNPPKYRETTVHEYVSHLSTYGLQSPLGRFRL